MVEGAPAAAIALVEVARDATRREWSFADVARAARTLACHIDEHGVRRGDTRRWTLADELPETASGKIRRAVLRGVG